jgi:hypothetical protein
MLSSGGTGKNSGQSTLENQAAHNNIGCGCGRSEGSAASSDLKPQSE